MTDMSGLFNARLKYQLEPHPDFMAYRSQLFFKKLTRRTTKMFPKGGNKG